MASNGSSSGNPVKQSGNYRNGTQPLYPKKVTLNALHKDFEDLKDYIHIEVSKELKEQRSVVAYAFGLIALTVATMVLTVFGIVIENLHHQFLISSELKQLIDSNK